MVVEERQQAAKTRRMPTLDELERVRRSTIARIQVFETRLSKMKMRGKKLRRGGLVALHLEEREGLKGKLAAACEQLRLVNDAIRAGRRSGMALLLTGQKAPEDDRSLVATMYRMFTDAVPPADQDDYQRGIMMMARDYVMSGPSVFGR